MQVLKFTQKQKEEIVDKYCNQYIGGINLAKEYGCSKPTIYSILKEFNIPRRQIKKITESDKLKIIKRYTNEHITCRNLGIDFGISHSIVSSILQEAGIEVRSRSRMTRRHQLNENYFDKIDTEEKAYFLGLLYADGCNHIKGNSVILGLVESDKYILEKFNLSIESTRPIILDNRTKIRRQPFYVLTISSKKMCDQLLKLGCMPRKSLVLKFPTNRQVPKKFIKHFIRGYFDGDGCFYYKQKKDMNCFAYCASLASTKDFCEKLKEILQKELDITCNYNKICKNQDITQSLSINNTNSVKFMTWIYDEASIFLHRKRDKFIKFMKELNAFYLIKYTHNKQF